MRTVIRSAVVRCNCLLESLICITRVLSGRVFRLNSKRQLTVDAVISDSSVSGLFENCCSTCPSESTSSSAEARILALLLIEFEAGHRTGAQQHNAEQPFHRSQNLAEF